MAYIWPSNDSTQQSITDIFVAKYNNCTQHSFHSQTMLIVEPSVSTNHKITTGSRFNNTTQNLVYR